MLQQAELHRGTTRTTGVVDHPTLLQAGATLAIRDDDGGRWTVAAAHQLPRAVPRGWHNNI
jgi:hypothetical protein